MIKQLLPIDELVSGSDRPVWTLYAKSQKCVAVGFFLVKLRPTFLPFQFYFVFFQRFLKAHHIYGEWCVFSISLLYYRGRLSIWVSTVSAPRWSINTSGKRLILFIISSQFFLKTYSKEFGFTYWVHGTAASICLQYC